MSVLILKSIVLDAFDTSVLKILPFESLYINHVSIFPNILIALAQLCGVYYPPALLFLLAIIVLGTCIIHVSVVITKQNKMIVRLNQEIGILKEKEDKVEENEKIK